MPKNFKGTLKFCMGIGLLCMLPVADANAKNLKQLCRDALGLGEVIRAYYDSSGRLICWHPAIETGSVYNHQTGGKYNFGSRYAPKKEKKKEQN